MSEIKVPSNVEIEACWDRCSLVDFRVAAAVEVQTDKKNQRNKNSDERHVSLRGYVKNMNGLIFFRNELVWLTAFLPPI